MTEIEFKPKQPNTTEIIGRLKDSTLRATTLAQMTVQLPDKQTPLEHLRAEKRVYLSYLQELKQAFGDRRVF